MSCKTTASISLVALLSGCAVNSVTTPSGMPTQPVRNAAVISPQERAQYSYVIQVRQIIAGHVEALLRKQEQSAIKKTGHPVVLPTGICGAVAVVQANGTVLRADLAQCSSDALGKVLVKAIHDASPLPPTPFGHNANITIRINDSETTPGVKAGE